MLCAGLDGMVEGVWEWLVDGGVLRALLPRGRCGRSWCPSNGSCFRRGGVVVVLGRTIQTQDMVLKGRNRTAILPQHSKVTETAMLVNNKW